MTKKRHDVAVQKVGPGPDHMPIGEFGGAAALPGDGSPFLSSPMYWLYEMGHAALTPMTQMRFFVSSSSGVKKRPRSTQWLKTSW